MPLRPSLTCVAALAAAIALVGCNEINGAAPDVSLAATPAASPALPAGAPCSGEISRYDAVVRDDLRTGNVEQKVYDQIERELARATAACAAGRGGEAHAIVAASKARHGYRA
jgi:hypothetical protein